MEIGIISGLVCALLVFAFIVYNKYVDYQTTIRLKDSEIKQLKLWLDSYKKLYSSSLEGCSPSSRRGCKTAYKSSLDNLLDEMNKESDEYFKNTK
jgi:hypothetical protein